MREQLKGLELCRLGTGHPYLVVFCGLVCVASLSLPNQGDARSSLPVPDYLYLTVPQKLVAAYVLGLITMLLLRQ